MTRSIWIALAVACVAGVAGADAKKPPPPFPVVIGTRFTFSGGDAKQTWTTKLAGDARLAQYEPHEDTMNYFSKAGLRVAPDGIYIVGEVLADLDQKPPAPARAIAFPIKKGGVGKVPGFIATTYTVGARETVKVPAGTYEAWKIAITDPANPAGAVWIAPGVGIVKIQLPSGRVDELIKVAPPDK